MSPRSQITPPPNRPHLPRQTYDPADPYGLSSLYAELSSLYPEIYSSYSYDDSIYSSILAEFSSMYPSITFPSYSYPGYSATANGAPQLTGTAVPATGDSSDSGSGGLSTGAKIGIGVGVPLAVLLLLGAGIFLWCAGKRKGKKSSTTVVAPVSTQNPHILPQHMSQAQFPQTQQQQPQMGHMNNQGYMPGFQQQGRQQMPPPQYSQPQPGQDYAAYGGYGKGPQPGVVEMEQEYHFARPGVVEMGDGQPEPQGKRK